MNIKPPQSTKIVAGLAALTGGSKLGTAFQSLTRSTIQTHITAI
jgi:hypothetical protein